MGQLYVFFPCLQIDNIDENKDFNLKAQHLRSENPSKTLKRGATFKMKTWRDLAGLWYCAGWAFWREGKLRAHHWEGTASDWRSRRGHPMLPNQRKPRLLCWSTSPGSDGCFVPWDTIRPFSPWARLLQGLWELTGSGSLAFCFSIFGAVTSHLRDQWHLKRGKR